VENKVVVSIECAFCHGVLPSTEGYFQFPWGQCACAPCWTMVAEHGTTPAKMRRIVERHLKLESAMKLAGIEIPNIVASDWYLSAIAEFVQTAIEKFAEEAPGCPIEPWNDDNEGDWLRLLDAIDTALIGWDIDIESGIQADSEGGLLCQA